MIASASVTYYIIQGTLESGNDNYYQEETVEEIEAEEVPVEVVEEEVVEEIEAEVAIEVAEEVIEIHDYIINQLQRNMAFIWAGTFTMGCTSEQGRDCDDDETTVHQVTINSFYMGKYEVTQAQWQAVMGNNPSYFSVCDNCPVEQVSWDDVQEFITKLNDLTYMRFRLPTEAEWEFAARGGNASRGFKYSGNNTLRNVAWYNENSGSKTHSVGQKNANELGLYDMSGNVWEWCNDKYGTYSSREQNNPVGPPFGSDRVIRGGSYYSFPKICRVSDRNSNNSGARYNDLGFRLALSD